MTTKGSKVTTQGLQQYSLFAIPNDILAQVSAVVEWSPDGDVSTDGTTASNGTAADGAETTETEVKSAYACGTCGIGLFVSVDLQRAHFRSDWHRANVTRRLRKQATLSQSDFDSVSGSGSASVQAGSVPTVSEDEEGVSDDSSDPDGDMDPTTLANTLANASIDEDGGDVIEDAVEVAGSPFVALRLTPPQQGDSATSTIAASSIHATEPLESVAALGLHVYKQVLFRKKDTPPDARAMVEMLQNMQRVPRPLPLGAGSGVPKWTLIMIAAGHFAAAVFEAAAPRPGSSANTFVPTVIEHKTFHRYTTRRKQGGAQSANDNSKGKANSAGSNLRRENERRLEQDIQALLTQWAPLHLVGSTHIFIRCPPRQTRKVIFFDEEKVLASSDPRVRSFPFITHRPTIPELMRAFEELTTVTIRDVASSIKTATATQGTGSLASTKKKVLDQVEALEAPAGPSPLQEPFKKLVDFVRRGKLDLLRTELGLVASKPDEPQDETTPAFTTATTLVNTRFDDAHGTSLLHVAAAAGHADVVSFLLAQCRADPTLREERGRVRPSYLLAESKEVRDVFRRAYAQDEAGRFDWAGLGAVPSPLSGDLEARQKEKEREKRRRQKAKQKEGLEARQVQMVEAAMERELEAVRKKAEEEEKAERARKAGVFSKLAKSERDAIGMTPERRAMLDREKRALAAEARFRAQSGKCSNCGMALTPASTFEKFQYKAVWCEVHCTQMLSEADVDFEIAFGPASTAAVNSPTNASTNEAAQENRIDSYCNSNMEAPIAEAFDDTLEVDDIEDANNKEDDSDAEEDFDDYEAMGYALLDGEGDGEEGQTLGMDEDDGQKHSDEVMHVTGQEPSAPVLCIAQSDLIGEEDLDTIKNVMLSFSMPEAAIPEWSKLVPEDKWLPKVEVQATTHAGR
ncbi:hypothetical protein BC830DRAFT_1169128 [Chytriomyces sp. MP71]|nr:hypothetical protein BC830DRAFT_1169128 [Chytriomyces sp. MP71]